MSSLTLRLLGVIEGWYRPRDLDEAYMLAAVAKANKLYLSFLRAARDYLYSDLVREEKRYSWYIGNALDVAKTLRGLRYAFYKFRKPFEHVSVDLDILIDPRHVSEAVSRLAGKGFKVIVSEPYTVTLRRGSFIVDLYTQPSFAWVIYVSGEDLLREYTEEFEFYGGTVRGITREAEVAVSAAHSVYKEHLAPLVDCLTLWKWSNKRVLDIADRLGVYDSIKILSSICHNILRGVEAPVRIHPALLAKAYFRKALEDPFFRGTSLNIIKYLIGKSEVGRLVLWRLTRKSY